MTTFEDYYDANPLGAINKNQWTEFDPLINATFQDRAVFTPLVQWADMNPNAQLYVTGRELLPGVVNHNSIGLRQKFITAAYVDSRERHIVSAARYGAKVQYDVYDEVINQWRGRGRAGFADGILRNHLSRSILLTHEKLARDATINNCNVVTYANGATNFAGLSASSDYKFNIQELRDVALRLSVRVKDAMLAWGEYDGAPIPGVNDMLVITTPGVIYDLWDQMDSRYMMDLRDLGDTRIINGGIVRYKGWTFAQTWDAALWNSGTITKQVGIQNPVTAGDGAYDPAVSAVDNTYYVGQNSSGVTHYVMTTGFSSTDFVAGDFVSLHTARTSAYGVSNGCDPLDGATVLMEVVHADNSTGELVFRMPVMEDFNVPIQDATLGTVYGYITKAAHVHPVYEIGARGHSLFAIRRGLKLHTPPAIDDFESVVRVSWDEYGQMNKWQGDLHEINYVRATFGNRGSLSV
jgi:hypothetical protein